HFLSKATCPLTTSASTFRPVVLNTADSGPPHRPQPTLASLESVSCSPPWRLGLSESPSSLPRPRRACWPRPIVRVHVRVPPRSSATKGVWHVSFRLP